MESILIFLAAKKTIIIGASLTISELVVIIANLIKRLKSNSTSSDLKTMKTLSVRSTSKVKLFFWACNPVNLFKKSDV